MKISKVFSNGLNPSIKKSLFILTLVLFSCGACRGEVYDGKDPLAVINSQNNYTVRPYEENNNLWRGRLSLEKEATDKVVVLVDHNGSHSWTYLIGHLVGKYIVFEAHEFDPLLSLPREVMSMDLKVVYRVKDAMIRHNAGMWRTPLANGGLVAQQRTIMHKLILGFEFVGWMDSDGLEKFLLQN